MPGVKQLDAALPSPPLTLNVGVTGHRSRHPVFAANHDAIAATLAKAVAVLAEAVADAGKAAGENGLARLRLLSLLANGADLTAVAAVRAHGWPVVAPLPFGPALNLAINAQPVNSDDGNALLAGHPASDPDTAARAAAIAAISCDVAVFALAEQDAAVEALFRAHLADPADSTAQQAFAALCSERAAMAARVMIEHSDFLIAIWDGVTHGTIGGTRHCIEAALDHGIAVLWIDARAPKGWRVLHAAEELACLSGQPGAAMEPAALRPLVRAALVPTGQGWHQSLAREKWTGSSRWALQAYRRVETLFGDAGARPFRSLKQRYEHPDAIAGGSGAAMLAAATALPGGDRDLPGQIAVRVLKPFAWADGVSTALADAYRGGMVASFFLSAFAIIGGIAYLPFASIERKWGFAVFEFLLLAVIVGIFFAGKRRRWHERWFATRRVAEYFRHAPILLLLGTGRASGRWPRGADGNWPEIYVRRTLRDIGLPQVAVTPDYLRAMLVMMRDQLVVPQRDYHRQKAVRLRRANHNLHRLSETLFVCAIIAVAAYLGLEVATHLGWVPGDWPQRSAKLFTFLGVLFPTLGGALAGVHYFGDFERFGSISDVVAQKLGDDVGDRSVAWCARPRDDLCAGGRPGPDNRPDCGRRD